MNEAPDISLEWSASYTLSAVCFTLRTHPRPDVKFSCDVDYDPFLFMQNHEKVYGADLHLPLFLTLSFI
jgi:hypothetical protein